ncbi:hypothetical protein BB560_000581 [Smittium megazygosporum]|uniref:FMP27 GFWDK domain-containing protein n=1 Tax=Smittium megazygosporum TaxID=133381 RepID=A0A2T9ZJY2_9FUNG|nr:hypothetical protein BB560_000581 [Smittium megazygosporum]
MSFIDFFYKFWNFIPSFLKNFVLKVFLFTIAVRILVLLIVKLPVKRFFLKHGLSIKRIHNFSFYHIKYSTTRKDGSTLILQLESVCFNFNILGRLYRLINPKKAASTGTDNHTSVSSQDSISPEGISKSLNNTLKKPSKDPLLQVIVCKPHLFIFKKGSPEFKSNLEDYINDEHGIKDNSEKSLREEVKYYEKKAKKFVKKISSPLKIVSNIGSIFLPKIQIKIEESCITLSKNKQSWQEGVGVTLKFDQITVENSTSSSSNNLFWFYGLVWQISVSLYQKLVDFILWLASSKKPQILRRPSHSESTVPSNHATNPDNNNNNILDTEANNESFLSADRDPTSYLRKRNKHSSSFPQDSFFKFEVKIRFEKIKLFRGLEAYGGDADSQNKSTGYNVMKHLGLINSSKERTRSVSEEIGFVIDAGSQITFGLHSDIWWIPNQVNVDFSFNSTTFDYNKLSAVIAEIKNLTIHGSNKSKALHKLDKYFDQIKHDLYDFNEGLTDEPEDSKSTSKSPNPSVNKDKVEAEFVKLLKTLYKETFLLKKKQLLIYFAGFLFEKISLKSISTQISIKEVLLKIYPPSQNDSSIFRSGTVVSQKDIQLSFVFSSKENHKKSILCSNKTQEIQKTSILASDKSSKSNLEKDSFESNLSTAKNSGDTLQNKPGEFRDKPIPNVDLSSSALSSYSLSVSDKASDLIEPGNFVLIPDFPFKKLYFDASADFKFQLGTFKLQRQDKNSGSSKSKNASSTNYSSGIEIDSFKLQVLIPISYSTDENLTFSSHAEIKVDIVNPKIVLDSAIFISILESIKLIKSSQNASGKKEITVGSSSKNPEHYSKIVSSIFSPKSNEKDSDDLANLRLNIHNIKRWGNISTLMKIFVQNITIHLETSNVHITVISDIPTTPGSSFTEKKTAIVLQNKSTSLISDIKFPSIDHSFKNYCTVFSESHLLYSVSPVSVYQTELKTGFDPMSYVNSSISDVILEFDGAEYIGNAEALLGWPYEFYKNQGPYIKFYSILNFGSLDFTLLEKKFITLIHNLPGWFWLKSIVLDGLNTNSSEFNKPERNIPKNHDTKKELNNLQEKSPPEESLHMQTRNNLYVPSLEISNSLKINFGKAKLKISTLDGDIDKAHSLSHGLIIRLKRFKLRMKQTKSYSEKKTTFNTVLDELSVSTMDLIPSTDPYDESKPSLVEEDEFLSRGWAIKNVDEFVFLNTVGTKALIIKNLASHSSTISVESNIPMLKARISSTNSYRCMTIFQQISILHSLSTKLPVFANNASTPVVIKSKHDKLFNCNIKIDSLDLFYVLPAIDIHDGETKAIYKKSNRLSEIKLTQKLSKVNIDINSKKTKLLSTTFVTIEMPAFKALAVGSVGEPVFVFANSKFIIESVKDLEATSSTKPSTKFYFDEGCFNIPHGFAMYNYIEGLILLIKLHKNIFRKIKSDCERMTSRVNNIFSKSGFSKVQGTVSADSIISIFEKAVPISFPSFRGDLFETKKFVKANIKPDIVPPIYVHGKSLSMLIQDDPFEIALSRIFQIGKKIQSERLNRMEAFEKKAAKIRQHRPAKPKPASTNVVDENSQSVPGAGKMKLKKTKTTNFINGVLPNRANTNLSLEAKLTHNKTKSSSTPSNPLLDRASNTFVVGKRNKIYNDPNIRSNTFNFDDASPATLKDRMNLETGSNKKAEETPKLAEREFTFTRLNNKLNAAPTIEVSEDDAIRNKTNSLIEEALYKLYELESKIWIKTIRKSMLRTKNLNPDHEQGSGENPISSSSLSKEQPLNVSDVTGFSLSGTSIASPIKCLGLNDLIDTVKAKANSVPSDTSSNLTKTEPHTSKADEPNPSIDIKPKLPAVTKPLFVETSDEWRFPRIPLFNLMFSPVRIKIETPEELNSFDSIENYMREIDPDVPRNQIWSTLVPLKINIKSGLLVLQMRDFPIPLIYFPDPFRSKSTEDSNIRHRQEFSSFKCGVAIEGGLIVCEQYPSDEAIRFCSIPLSKVCVISPQLSTAQMISSGQYDTGSNSLVFRLPIFKTLSFPRVLTNFSVSINNSATIQAKKAVDFLRSGDISKLDELDISVADLKKILSVGRLPVSSPLICWSQRIQPTLTEISQNFEGITSPQSEPSPSLGWWDKLRAKAKIRCRFASIDIPIKYLVPENSWMFTEGDGCVSSVLGHQTGEILFYSPSSRDPYSLDLEDSGYLLSFRGGVRFAIGEDDPRYTDSSSPLKRIYKINAGDAFKNPPSVAPPLFEVLQIRCMNFLCGVPNIASDKFNAFNIMLYSSKHYRKIKVSIKGEENMEASFTTLLRTIKFVSKNHQVELGCVSTTRNSIFIKTLCHLKNGVKLALGFSYSLQENKRSLPTHASRRMAFSNGEQGSFIDQNNEFTTWDTKPHAPENVPAESLDTYDCFKYFRSSGLHLGIAMKCPFQSVSDTWPQTMTRNTEEVSLPVPRRRDTILSKFSNTTDDRSSVQSFGDISEIPRGDSKISRLRDPDVQKFGTFSNRKGEYSGVDMRFVTREKKMIPGNKSKERVSFAKKPEILDDIPSSSDETDSYSSSFYSDGYNQQQYSGYNTNTSESELDNREQEANGEIPVSEGPALDEYSSVFNHISPLHAVFYEKEHKLAHNFVSPLPLSLIEKCADVDETSSYDSNTKCKANLSIETNRMFMNYVHTFSSQLMLPIKRGKLFPGRERKDINHSQQVSEVKELENQEIAKFWPFDGAPKSVNELFEGVMKLQENLAGSSDGSFDGSRVENSDSISPAKVEGNLFQLKGRSKLLESTLLMVQQHKIVKIGADKKSKADISDSLNLGISKTDSSRSANSQQSSKKEKHEVTHHWHIQDIDAELDDFDVRIVKMKFLSPLFLDDMSLKINQWVEENKLVKSCGLTMTKEAHLHLQQVPEKMCWIDSGSTFDLGSFAILNSIIHEADVLSLLWAPRMIYFTQSTESQTEDDHENDSYDLESKPSVSKEPAHVTFSRSHSISSNSDSSDSGQSSSDSGILLNISSSDHQNHLKVPQVLNKRNSHKQIRRKTKKDQASATHGGFPAKRNFSSVNSLRFKRQTHSSVSKLSLKKPNMSSSLSVSGNIDYRKVLRDSHLTMTMLLSRRKARLGYVIDMKRNELFKRLHHYENRPEASISDFQNQLSQNFDEIVELSTRRRLINQCMEMLGINDPQNSDFSDIDSQDDVSNGEFRDTGGYCDGDSSLFEHLYRHRVLLHSAYLLWNSDLRNSLLEFFYNEDLKSALRYFLSQQALQTVNSLNPKKSFTFQHEENLAGSKNLNRTIDVEGGTYNPNNPLSLNSKAENSYKFPGDKELPPKFGYSDTSSRSFPNTESDLTKNSGGNYSYKAEVDHKDPFFEGSNYALSRMASSDKSILRHNEVVPYFYLLVEFLNSQISLTLDESSQSSVVSTVERGQYSMLKLCVDPNYSESEKKDARKTVTKSTTSQLPGIGKTKSYSIKENNTTGRPSENGNSTASTGSIAMQEYVSMLAENEENVLKIRMIGEVSNMQVFTVKRSDFIDCPLYLMDCFYGANVDTTKLSCTLWPVWVPIEILINHEHIESNMANIDPLARSSCENSDPKSGSRNKRYNSKKKHLQQSFINNNLYSRVIEKISGITVYDKPNSQRIQSRNVKFDDLRVLSQNSNITISNDQALKKLKRSLLTCDCSLLYEDQNIGKKVSIDSAESIESLVNGINSPLPKGDDSRAPSTLKPESIAQEASNTYLLESENDNKRFSEIEGKHVNSDDSNSTYILVRVSKVNIKCTSEQYLAIMDLILNLLIYIAPERSSYLDELNSVKLSTDLSSIKDAGPIVNQIQNSLRSRRKMLQEWHEIQWNHNEDRAFRQFNNSGFSPTTAEDSLFLVKNSESYNFDQDSLVSNQSRISPTVSINHFRHFALNGGVILSLSRQIKQLEYQLRITMDLISSVKRSKEKQEIFGTNLHTKNESQSSSRAINTPTIHSSPTTHSEPILGMDVATDKNLDSVICKNVELSSDLKTSGSIKSGVSEAFSTKNAKSIWNKLASEPRSHKRSSSISSRLYSNLPNLTAHERANSIMGSIKSNSETQSVSENSVGEKQFNKGHSIAQKLSIHVSSLNLSMLDKDNRTICDVKTRNLYSSVITSSSQAIDVILEVDVLIALNRIKNATFPQIIVPRISEKEQDIDFSKNKMIKLYYSELPSVGGIRIVELLEIDIAPLKIMLSHDIGKTLINYFFPSSDSNDDKNSFYKEQGPENINIPSKADGKKSTRARIRGFIDKQLDKSSRSHRRTNSDFKSNRLVSKGSDDESSDKEMITSKQNQTQTKLEILTNSDLKARASSNKTYMLIRIPSRRFIISYHGRKKSNISDLSNFEFKSPNLEFRNEVISQYELMMRLKKAFINAALQHTGALFKEKFKQLKNRKLYLSKQEADHYTESLVRKIENDDTTNTRYQSTKVRIDSNSRTEVTHKSDFLQNLIPNSLFTPFSYIGPEIPDLSSEKKERELKKDELSSPSILTKKG